jgi:hypothetical protein
LVDGASFRAGAPAAPVGHDAVDSSRCDVALVLGVKSGALGAAVCPREEHSTDALGYAAVGSLGTHAIGTPDSDLAVLHASGAVVQA